MELKRLFQLGSYIIAAICSLVDVIMKMFIIRMYQLMQPLTHDFSSIMSSFRFVMTSTWVGLGGLVQLFILLFCLQRQQRIAQPFSVPLQLVMICAGFILLSPVVINIYSAYVVFRDNTNDDRDIHK